MVWNPLTSDVALTKTYIHSTVKQLKRPNGSPDWGRDYQPPLQIAVNSEPDVRIPQCVDTARRGEQDTLRLRPVFNRDTLLN